MRSLITCTLCQAKLEWSTNQNDGRNMNGNKRKASMNTKTYVGE
jgi:hypothetical protein